MFASELQKDLYTWVVQQSGIGLEADYISNRISIILVKDNAEYTATINDVDFTVDSGADATAVTIAAALVAAINLGTEPVTAVSLGNGVYTLTADDQEVPYTLSLDANQLSSTDKVIWEHSNAPRPQRSYLSLAISNISVRGQPESIIQDDGIILLESGLELTVTVNAYSQYTADNIDAMILLNELSVSTAKQNSLDYFRAKKLGFLGVASLVNINELRGSEFEQRASMDLIFQTAMGIYDDVGWVEKISGTSTFNDTILNNYEINI